MLDLEKVKKVCAEHETLAEQAKDLDLTPGTWRQYRSGLMLAGAIPKLIKGARAGRSFDGDELAQAIGKTRPVVTTAVLAHIGAANSAAGTLVWTKSDSVGEVILSFKADAGKTTKASKRGKGK